MLSAVGRSRALQAPSPAIREPPNMYAAAVGSWTPTDEKCLQAAAISASTRVDFATLEDAARRMEEHAQEPRCVFVSHDANLGAVVGKLRERASLLTVPVIAVVPHATESVYRGAVASGAGS